MFTNTITRETLRLGLCAALLSLTAAAQAQQTNWAEKMVNKKSIDFGVIARGSHSSFRVVITNIYKETVHISDVRTTCGCSAGKPSKRTLLSRETGFIEVTMDTRKFTRRKDSNLIVTFDKPLLAELRIPITAYIRTDVVFEPGFVNFGKIDQGTESKRKVTISYAGRDDWQIKEVRSKNKNVAGKVVETSRGNGRVGYDLFISLAPSVPAGVIRERLMLITDDAKSPQVPILVEGRVEADITVTISPLGKLIPGKEKTINVVVRGKEPFEIKAIKCETSENTFKVRLPKKAAKVHVFPLTVTPPNKPGPFKETFTLTVPGRPNAVTFIATGQIADTTTK